MQVLEQNRRASEHDDNSVKAYLAGNKKYFDARENHYVVKILAGDCYVTSHEDEMLSTILGSCVSACIRDPVANVGGMNHFLLPGNKVTHDLQSDSARYGVFAMENLINNLINAGAKKSRFEIKVFGGGNVTNNSARIGSNNAAFVREFLQWEGYKITSEDLEGPHARKIHYFPHTGKVMVRLLRRKEDLIILDEEQRYSSELAEKAKRSGHVELF